MRPISRITLITRNLFLRELIQKELQLWGFMAHFQELFKMLNYSQIAIKLFMYRIKLLWGINGMMKLLKLM